MKTEKNTAKLNALSDSDLDIVTGGQRHQVSKETYELLLLVRWAVSGSK